MEFHWWYILIAVVILFLFFGKGKGGRVLKRMTADMQILDDRFNNCEPEAKHSCFKEGQPDHIDFEIKKLTIPVGDKIEFHLNGKLLSKAIVTKNNKAKFDHWSDEDITFPVVIEGDKLVIKYQGIDVLSGVFALD